MDRQIVYPGSIPLDTDILNMERSALIAIGYLAQATLGTGMVVDGLTCVPTQPASMTITIGPGCITQYSVVDTTAFGSLPAEPSEPLLKMGVNVGNTVFTLVAPTTPGEAINYLIEASFLESDATPIILPYYNAANPSLPYSGPGNSGASQNTQRLESVQLQVKSGAPASAGNQLTPSVDAGWAGLYVVTVETSQTAITASSIANATGAPFVPWKLPLLSPGTSRMAEFTPASQGNWAVPAGVNRIRLKLWGGGGAGGAGLGGGGGGGAGGGYAEGFYAVTPGQTFFVTVGGGGVGAGTNGGVTSFGSIATAAGGQAGGSGGEGIGGGGGAAGGAGGGGTFNASGQAGGGAFLAGSVWVSGRGGAAYGSTGAEIVIAASGSDVDGHSATLPGGGGGGGSGAGVGGQGGPGLVLLEW